MAAEEKVTYCRICEPLCGLVATVEDGEVTKLRPDADHPLSAGFACPKGIAMTDVQNDPDRVLHPLQRRADGEFEQVSWDAALDEIGARLKAVIDEHGGDSRRLVHGQPRRLLLLAPALGARLPLGDRLAATTTRPPPRTSPTASRRARCSTARPSWSRSPT